MATKRLLSEELELPIDMLIAYGISASTVNMLSGIGLTSIQDLLSIDKSRLPLLGLRESELNCLQQLWNEVNIEMLAKKIKVTLNVEDFISHKVRFDSEGSLPSSVILYGEQVSCHDQGTCRPCAWYHHQLGCKNGESCQFCHICGPNELQMRKKQKNKLMKLTKDIFPSDAASSTRSPRSDRHEDHHLE